MSLTTHRRICCNPKCGHVSTFKRPVGDLSPIERTHQQCGSCGQRTIHRLWLRRPITGRWARQVALLVALISATGCLRPFWFSPTEVEVDPCYELTIYITFDPEAVTPIATDSTAQDDCGRGVVINTPS